MKERYYKFYELFVVISVITSIAAQSVYDQQIMKYDFLKDNKEISVFIGFLASLGIFYFLFSSLLHFYQVYLWKFLDKRYLIDGLWNVIVTKSQGEPHKLYGTVSIEQSHDSVCFSAKHYINEQKTELWSHWTSTNVFIVNGNIEVYWEVMRMNSEIVTGKITFKTDGKKPPMILEGIFRDNYPSNSVGHMYYERA